jgi:hypothetical protein
MKNIITLLLTATLLIIVGCDKQAPKSDAVIQAKQERALQEMVRQTGLPAITNFQEKKMLYELRDQEDLVCYAYLMNEMTGEIGQFIGTCIGYGLPASTQYSNPEKIVNYNYRRSAAAYKYETIPQAEPNGLFMPEGLSATWLMMIDPTTKEARPVYIEPAIIVSPFKLK